jgi:molybdopterin/thiamine biosynthesis adenylyltransferase
MNICVMGLGAIGSNLMLQLAQKYPNYKFTGIDFDTVEERNIATQQYIIPQIGMRKANAMQVILGMNLRRTNYTGVVQKIENTGQVSLLTGRSDESVLIIDCFDNTESRKILHKFASNVDILHIGFSPQYTAEIIWDEEYTVPNDIPADQNDICEMSEAVPFINFVVSLACMTISDFFHNNIKKSLIITNKNNILRLN